MKKTKEAGPKGAGSRTLSTLDFETVRELARVATEFNLTEVEVEPSGRIRISRVVEAATGVLPAPSLHAVAASPGTMVEPHDTGHAGGTLIASPFVGTFYRSPSPEVPQFTDVGQKVRKGQVVCIVEAMKLMNEIESEVDGRVAEIFVTNGQSVEYAQPLFRIEKN
jgi:acetyl-CoA carboxylase biotin carboxyl carrier protein